MIQRVSEHIGNGQHRAIRFYADRDDAELARRAFADQGREGCTITAIPIEEAVHVLNDLLDLTNPPNAKDGRA